MEFVKKIDQCLFYERGNSIMQKDICLWRMNIKPDSCDGVDPFLFCKKNDILGFGWRLKDEFGNQIVPKDIEDCLRLGKKQYGSKGFVQSINAFKEIEIDDLVWTRYKGLYYLCRILGKWGFSNTDENYAADVLNIVPVEFLEVGTVENVPGKVVNSFRASSVIQRVHGYDNEGKTVNPALDASMKIYNEIKGLEYYNIHHVSKEDILDLFLPEDMEEIIGLYLQFKKNYLLYSSSNKIDTETYEFVMISRNGDHLCYPQVKTGNVSLNGDDYTHLTKSGNKVYLFAVSGRYFNVDDPNIIPIRKDEILHFIYENKIIMPPRIKMWL